MISIHWKTKLLEKFNVNKFCSSKDQENQYIVSQTDHDKKE